MASPKPGWSEQAPADWLEATRVAVGELGDLRSEVAAISLSGQMHGAVMLGMAGTAQMKRAEDQAYFMAAVNGVYGGAVIPVPGGVLVRDRKGAVIGAVGVTGDTSDNDAAAATFGIEAVGLTAEI